MTRKPVGKRASSSSDSAAIRAAQTQALARLVAAAEWVIGSDEAGYGTWAGDLIVCAVAVRKTWVDETVTDSKDLTDKARREIVARYRASPDVLRVIHRTSPPKIDERGVWAAAISSHNEVHRALEEKLQAVHPGVTFVHIADGFENAHLKLDARIVPLAKADKFVPAVSLASCFAKVVQCELMHRAGEIYPGYGFEKHHGYGTQQHRRALASLGVLDIHRKSYRPIRNLIGDGSPPHSG